MVNILLVDDHPLFRAGFAHMMRALRPHWTLRFADSAAQAHCVFAEEMTHLVIIDVMLPDSDGFALLQTIAKISPRTPQILISGRDDMAVRIRAKACGARSFIAKTAAPEVIAGTLDLVLAGGSSFGPEPSDQLLPILTTRQSEVLMLLAAGLSNKEIRHHLGIAERTVRSHLTELFTLLRVSSRMQAVLRARQLGLIA